MGEDARGKGSSLGRRVNGGRARARGVEADAHRVPAVNVDYARALNLCACIYVNALWTWPFLRRGLKSVQGDRRPPTLDKIRQNIFITAIPLSPSRNLPASRVNALSCKIAVAPSANKPLSINKRNDGSGWNIANLRIYEEIK